MGVLYMPWNRILIYNFTKGRIFFMLLNYIIIYMSGLLLFLRFRNSKLKQLNDIRMYLLLVVLFPCFAIIFGAVETRFFMPMYVLLYALISFSDYKQLFLYVQRNCFKVIFSMILILFLLLGYWGNIMSNANALPQLLK